MLISVYIWHDEGRFQYLSNRQINFFEVINSLSQPQTNDLTVRGDSSVKEIHRYDSISLSTFISEISYLLVIFIYFAAVENSAIKKGKFASFVTAFDMGRYSNRKTTDQRWHYPYKEMPKLVTTY